MFSQQVLLQKDSQIKALQTTLEAMESQVGMLESRKKEIEKQNEEVNKLYYNKLYVYSLVNCFSVSYNNR